MTPKPRLADVEVYREKQETVRLGGLDIQTDKIIIHPDVGFFARIAVDPPDSTIWLYDGGPTTFLRFEGLLLELTDPRVRVDLPRI